MKFLYCFFCKIPIAKNNFQQRHLHATVDLSSLDAAKESNRKLSAKASNRNFFIKMKDDIASSLDQYPQQEQESNRKLFIKMKDEIVSTWSDKKNCRPPCIHLKDYIKQVQVEYELDPVDYPVTVTMVNNQYYRNNSKVKKR